MVGIVLLGIFVLLLVFGAPIAVCLGMSSVGAILVQGAGKPLEAIMSVLPRLCSSASSKFVLLAIPFFILSGNVMEKAGISGRLINLAEKCIMSVLPRLCSSASSKFVLLAIPFFILSGNVMEKAGISGRLINLAEKCLGHIRGGMAMVCVAVSCFFAAISGSGPATVAALGLIMIPALVKAGYPAAFSCALMAAGGAAVSCFFAAISGSGPATVAALGLIMIPALVKAGYPAAFSCALMAAGGAIGVVIPPSITFVVYGSIADASITDLFISGLIPGLLMGAGLIVAALVLGRKMDLKVRPKASAQERLKAFKDAFWGLLMPVIILGGIYGSIFTPTEAAAVSVFYGLIVGVFVYREINLKKMVDILIERTRRLPTSLSPV